MTENSDGNDHDEQSTQSPPVVRDQVKTGIHDKSEAGQDEDLCQSVWHWKGWTAYREDEHATYECPYVA